MKTIFNLLTVPIVILISAACTRDCKEGTAIITQYGYNNCIELKNSDVRVVLEPNMGGRVLVYELNGKNVLYRDTLQNGVIYEHGVEIRNPSGGRFDIGP
jgi:hypothetical protein